MRQAAGKVANTLSVNIFAVPRSNHSRCTSTAASPAPIGSWKQLVVTTIRSPATAVAITRAAFGSVTMPSATGYQSVTVTELVGLAGT